MCSWKILIQPADRSSFEYKASFALSGLPAGDGSRNRELLGPKYLYGQGDLAVFLEDLGADSGEIWGVLADLNDRATAEILVNVADEALEILLPGGPAQA
jgi:hypothetical protein